MGLFADKITTVVSSSVYNLAGDEDLQSDPIKSAVIGSILSGRGNLSASISGVYTQGTANAQKIFLRYMQSTHPTYLITGQVNSFTDVSGAAIITPVSQLLGLTTGQTLRIGAAKIDVGEIDYWAEDWVQKNHPTLTRADWFAEFNTVSNQIVISLPDLITASIAAPADLLWATQDHSEPEQRKLLYVSYSVIDPASEGVAASESLEALFTYRIGSGNLALDGLANASQPMPEFYPALPLRLRNKSLRHADYVAEYAVAKAGYKKLTRQKLDDMLDSIEENPDVGDIDYAFLVHGVCLNTKNHVAKEYLYRFLSELKDVQTLSKVEYDTYKDRILAAEQSRMEWERYLHYQENDFGILLEEPPALPQEVATEPPLNTFEISAPALPNLRQRMSWSFMNESIMSGNCQRFDGDANRTKANPGEYHIHMASPYKFKTRIRYNGSDNDEPRYYWGEKNLPRMFLMYQINPFSYKRLEIVGFVHENFVYKTETVKIKAEDALSDPEPSGFLVPLHAPTLSGMGMSKATRLAGSTSHIVFNSYERVRKKWYERALFRILLIAAVAALSVIIPGLGGAAASGILGSNLAVGTALGMTSALSAAIAGAIANALAAVVVATLISSGATALFGDKVGAVIGAIAFFVSMSYMTSISTSGSFEWSKFMSADNILRLADATVNGVTAYMDAETREIYEKIGDVRSDEAAKMEEIEQLYKSMLGDTGVDFDPMELTNAAMNFSESSQAFLSRTLLTGTDVVNITHSMISDFVEISLELPEAIA